MKLKMEVFPPPGVDDRQACIFAFQEDKLLLFNDSGKDKKEEKYWLPKKHELRKAGIQVGSLFYLGTLGEKPCYTAEVVYVNNSSKEIALLGLREVFGLINDDLFEVASHARQILHWDKTHRYCCCCGTPTGYSNTERAKVCPGCNSVYYPRIAPAIIVAVHRGDKILLARNQRFRRNYYSVLAGFVEAGESLEDCLKREVREETGIEVKKIKYFASQSWPFPNALMVGFTAEYAGGEIKLDGKEIADAGWFSAESLPPVPGKVSIARSLIDHFINKQK